MRELNALTWVLMGLIGAGAGCSEPAGEAGASNEVAWVAPPVPAPAPVDGSPPAKAEPAVPAPQEPGGAAPAVNPADIDELARALRATGPFPEQPREIDYDALPGDGQQFPLVVEFVNADSGEPLEGWLADSWSLWEVHPKSPDKIHLQKYEHDEEVARITFPGFPPSRWIFERELGGRPTIQVDTFLAVQPPGGRFVIGVPEIVLRGVVVGPDGAGLSSRSVSFTGHGVDLQSNVPEAVRYAEVRVETTTDSDGRFVIPGFVPGRYLVMFRGTREREGAMVEARIRRVVTIRPDNGELRLGPDMGER